MRRQFRFAALLLAAALAPNAFALCSKSIQLPDGPQSSGAIYRIYMPEQSCWNGSLVVYAHGYVDFTQPIAIPEDQLVLPDGTSIPGIINSLGYGFAMSSYSQNGLAIIPGVADSLDVIDIFTNLIGKPGKVYMAGVSEGGLIATLSLEQHFDKYDAGLAACGPIGDFNRQLSYDGDFRVVWDYFFPGVIPGSPLQIPDEVITDWDSVYVPKVEAAYEANPLGLAQLLHVTNAPIQLNPFDVSQTVDGVLWYSTFGTNDATAKLNGQPYDNSTRAYSGSLNDFRLNRTIPRFTADPAALETVAQSYQTTGKLINPLVTLHTIGDQIVPYFHEPLYSAKVRAQNSDSMHALVPVARFGHCNFEVSDVLLAFVIMLRKSGALAPSDADQLISNPTARAQFQSALGLY